MELRAVLLNCTIKKSPEVSNTQALMDRVIDHLEQLGVVCETIRVVDHHVRFGVSGSIRSTTRWAAWS